jgi:hypothetical protein
MFLPYRANWNMERMVYGMSEVKFKPRGRPFSQGFDERRGAGRSLGNTKVEVKLRDTLPKMLGKIIDQALEGDAESVLVCIEVFGRERTRKLFLGGNSGDNQGDQPDSGGIQNVAKGTKAQPSKTPVC